MISPAEPNKSSPRPPVASPPKPRTLDLDKIEETLNISLYEEKDKDDLLTALVTNYINAEERRE